MKRYVIVAAVLIAVTGIMSTALWGCSSTTPSAPEPAPIVSSISPTAGLVGTQVTLSGLYFGATQGTSQVTFHGAAGVIGSWSDNIILASVPEGAETGDVQVTTPAGTSNAMTFTVTTVATAPTPATPSTPAPSTPSTPY